MARGKTHHFLLTYDRSERQLPLAGRRVESECCFDGLDGVRVT